MDIYFVNSITDALNSIMPDHDFTIVVNCTKDTRFPVYVTYTVELSDFFSWIRIRKSRRVHNRETEGKDVKRRLIAEVLSELFMMAADGSLPIKKLELKF